MIKNIKSIKNFGIFKEYSNSGVGDFGKYNLVFGWNGSGKSTLATLFESLEKKKLPDPIKFPSVEFTVSRGQGNAITNNNIADTDLNIYTFNESFIKENIDWNTSMKSILLVAKEKIDERKELDRLKKQQEKDALNHANEEVSIQALNSEVSKFLSDKAKRVKMSLRVIDTKDSFYLNYDKTKFEKFIVDHETEVNNKSSILGDDKIIQLTHAAKPDQKPAIPLLLSILNTDTVTKAKESLDDLLRTSAVSKTIERLTSNPDIQTWVSSGLDLHKKHKTTNCEFCGNVIAEDRLKEIEAHFSEEYKKFKDRLTNAEQGLGSQYVKADTLPTEDVFYEEFKKGYNVTRTELDDSVKAVNVEIQKWHEALKKKVENPFDTALVINAISEIAISSYNNAVKKVEDIIKLHNNKTANFEEETKKSKKRLELHYAATEVKDFDYYTKKGDIATRTEANLKLMSKITESKSEIQRIEDSLSNESIGANQFNESLHKFIGRRELSLRFNKNIMGYEIIRFNSGNHDGNLSEGEKTAIAFVYFMTKLSENDNKMKDTIVVIDDPVSSFDSNHLFHAYSFLKNNCGNAKQLFILTHNFTFFKLIRDWFIGNNINRKNRPEPKEPNAFFYIIETSTTTPRIAVLKNADKTLTDYNSEYHYLFSKLYKYKESANLNREDAFLTANLARKLLESFFCFKYPKHRSDVAQLMECGVQGCTVTTKETKEKFTDLSISIRIVT